MLIEQPPTLLRHLYPQAWWRLSKEKQIIYLTFDDGPIPEVTPWVLDLLSSCDVQATFFMVGENAARHPELLRRVLDEGHRVGNHSYNHLRGFGCSVEEYMDNVRKADSILHTNLFRPPYGRITFGQYRALQRSYQVVMWDVVTRDYSDRLTPEEVLAIVKRYVRNGSIITFHDSLKSWRHSLRTALPQAITYLKEAGYQFRPLP